MKFSSSLKFNAVSEWWDDYIDYDGLKKRIYLVEKQQSGLDTNYHDIESQHSPLLGHSDSDQIFSQYLDRELRKITIFYQSQAVEFLEDAEVLEVQVAEQEEAEMRNYPEFDEEDEDEEDEDGEREGEDETAPQPGETSKPRKKGRRRRSSTLRRLSLSSSEGGADLDAGISSLRRGSSSLRGKSPRVSARTLVNTWNTLTHSVSSASAQPPDTIWTSDTDYAWDVRLLFKRRITNLYVSVASLKSYVELNYSGFRKILKKYDKVTFSELKDRYLHDVVEHAPPFTQASKDKIAATLHKLLHLYAHCVTKGDVSAAQRQLKLHQRENIAWERDTVWRQMIGRERRGEADGHLETVGGTLAVQQEAEAVQIPTPLGRLKLKRRHIWQAIAVAVFVTLLNVQSVNGDEANSCFAILVFATILWATEAIPLFVTSIFVPLLLVCLRVVRSTGEDGTVARLTPPEATKYIFSVMFSPTIMLLIGGFTIASALSKTAIDRVLITKVLSMAGTRPNTVLLAFMGVSCFASMWISNVAAPTLCFTLIRPILRTLPPKSTFAPCLILGIALAANIGGQSSPISSPQNLIALQHMDPPLDWARWFAVALPVSAVSIVLIWWLLLVSYNPARSPDPTEPDIEVKPIRATKEPFTLKQYWVSFVCLATIGLWCVEHQIEPWVGDMGIIAIIPIVAFFSTGVLKKDDFEHFLWTVVFLAMGGIALGKGVTTSGLLDVMDEIIRGIITDMSLYSVVLVLSGIVLVVSTFISHTIASVLLVPIAKEVGKNLPGQHANLLIFLTGLICSTGMGMPVSGFPNQTAATQEDELGQLYLSNVDFLKNGVPASIVAAFVVATIGYLLMKVVGL